MNNESKVVIVIHFSYLTIFFFPWEKFWPNAGELQTWPRYPGRSSCGFTSNITFFVMFVISNRPIISKQPHQVDTSWYKLFGKWEKYNLKPWWVFANMAPFSTSALVLALCSVTLQLLLLRGTGSFMAFQIWACLGTLLGLQTWHKWWSAGSQPKASQRLTRLYSHSAPAMKTHLGRWLRAEREHRRIEASQLTRSWQQRHEGP